MEAEAPLRACAAHLAAAREVLRGAASRLGEGAALGEEALERLRPMQRAVEEAAALAGAASEPEELQVLLRLRERALRHRTEAEALCEEEARQILDLRRACAEYGHIAGRDRMRQERIVDTSQASRLEALEAQSRALRESIARLTEETEGVTAQLGTSHGKLRGEDEKTLAVARDLAVVDQDNIKARWALRGDDGITYRRKKEAERSEATSLMNRAQQAFDATMRGYDDEVTGERAAYRSGLLDLESEVSDLKARLSEEQAQVDRNLARQGFEHGRALQEVDDQVASQVSDLEAIREQRSVALKREVVQTRQLVEDATTGAQRALENHVKEAKVVFNARLQREQARAECAVQAELQAVADAQRERQEWERKVAKIKADYKVHTVKSRTYVKSLDASRQKQLIDLWQST